MTTTLRLLLCALTTAALAVLPSSLDDCAPRPGVLFNPCAQLDTSHVTDLRIEGSANPRV